MCRCTMDKLRELWVRIKHEWNIRSPGQRWRIVYLIGKASSDLIGVTVYGDMKNYWYSYFPGLMGFFHISMVFYTVWYYFSRGEYKRGMECTITSGFVITVLRIRLYSHKIIALTFHLIFFSPSDPYGLLENNDFSSF